MQRDVILFDALATHEIAIAVVKHFIAVDVAVIIRRGDAFGVIVKETWHERTNHEVIASKGLMSGWWHVQAPCNRLKIAHVENPGEQIAIPTNHIKGVMVKHMA